MPNACTDGEEPDSRSLDSLSEELPRIRAGSAKVQSTNSPLRAVLQELQQGSKKAASKTLRVVLALPVHCLQQLDCALHEFDATG
eukprot:CAMPEP_0181411316 /NCGR_PEP_ID=MMETSP1110-20121109/7811_1 /TAXON_ID=174948 /ORGANISM="Symbiodinium sp., Strain CCMP421" /LENGTH=84 /DNA_ID=CAMNT_0023533929 /DNA_START=55 /DNA_END=306 /DNA_ORIENTATION=+